MICWSSAASLYVCSAPRQCPSAGPPRPARLADRGRSAAVQAGSRSSVRRAPPPCRERWKRRKRDEDADAPVIAHGCFLWAGNQLTRPSISREWPNVIIGRKYSIPWTQMGTTPPLVLAASGLSGAGTRWDTNERCRSWPTWWCGVASLWEDLPEHAGKCPQIGCESHPMVSRCQGTAREDSLGR
jgi:hypothetical protein